MGPLQRSLRTATRTAPQGAPALDELHSCGTYAARGHSSSTTVMLLTVPPEAASEMFTWKLAQPRRRVRVYPLDFGKVLIDG
jgi:hypothetical protein